MAEKIWIGDDAGNEGDFNVAANWSPSGVPVAGDTLIFQDNAQDLDSNADHLSGTSGNLVSVKSTYTGTVGTLVAPLTMGVVRACVDNGTIYIDDDTGDGGNVAIVRGGTAYLDGLFVDLYAVGGNVFCGEGAGTAFDATNITADIPHASEPGVAVDNTITIAEGIVDRLLILNSLFTVTATGGTIKNTYVHRGIMKASGANLNNVYLFPEGTFRLLADATYTTQNIYGGTYIATETGVAKLVTTMNVYESAASINLANGQANQTITNLNLYASPELILDRFETMTISEI